MTEPAKKTDALTVVRAELSSPAVQKQFEHALPSHINRERFTRIAMSAIATNPDLLDCNRMTLFQSVMSCAQLGLMPEPQLGEAYFVPYKGKVTLQIGYKGMLRLARNSGQISTIETGIVHENDGFEWVMGTTSKFEVRPKLGQRGEPIAAFAKIAYRDGGFEYEVMTVEQIEEIRKNSPTGNSPAWRSSWGEMARKTVLRRLLKKAPLSTDARMAVEADEAIEERGEVYRLTHDAGLEREDPPPRQEPAPKPRGKRGPSLDEMANAAEATVAQQQAPAADASQEGV
jgi:recombination protein RecT